MSFSPKKRLASNADLHLKEHCSCVGNELDNDDNKPTSLSCTTLEELCIGSGSRRSRRKLSSASEGSFEEQTKKDDQHTFLRIDSLVERMVEMEKDREKAAMKEKTSKLQDILQLMTK